MDEKELNSSPVPGKSKLPEREKDLRPHKCEICGASFKRAGHLREHNRTHAGKKPYQCETCSKTFSTHGNLRYHFLVHSGLKLYACENCEKKFARAADLRKHTRIHTGEKPFKCWCGHAYISSSARNVHQKRIHSKHRPYVCSFCKAGFIHKVFLEIHERTHSGVKPFACQFCNATFARNYTLQLHKRIHTREKPHLCAKCGHAFRDLSNMNRHMKLHMKINATLHDDATTKTELKKRRRVVCQVEPSSVKNSDKCHLNHSTGCRQGKSLKINKPKATECSSNKILGKGSKYEPLHEKNVTVSDECQNSGIVKSDSTSIKSDDGCSIAESNPAGVPSKGLNKSLLRKLKEKITAKIKSEQLEPPMRMPHVNNDLEREARNKQKIHKLICKISAPDPKGEITSGSLKKTYIVLNKGIKNHGSHEISGLANNKLNSEKPFETNKEQLSNPQIRICGRTESGVCSKPTSDNNDPVSSQNLLSASASSVISSKHAKTGSEASCTFSLGPAHRLGTVTSADQTEIPNLHGGSHIFPAPEKVETRSSASTLPRSESNLNSPSHISWQPAGRYVPSHGIGFSTSSVSDIVEGLIPEVLAQFDSSDRDIFKEFPTQNEDVVGQVIEISSHTNVLEEEISADSTDLIDQGSNASSDTDERCDVNFNNSEHTEIKDISHDVKTSSDCSKSDHAYSGHSIRPSIENVLLDEKCSNSASSVSFFNRLNPPRKIKTLTHLNDSSAECIALGNDPVDHQYRDSEETGFSNKNILSITRDFKHPDVSNLPATQESEKHLNQDLIEKLMKDCEAKMAVCQHCEENCTSLKLLKKHYVTVHKLNPYLCNVCGKGFNDAKLLTKHMNAEKHGVEVLKCTICHKILGSLVHLKEHYLAHAKMWSYKCADCEKGFIRASDLRKHVQVHTGEKLYKCLDCNSCFNSSSSLYQHHKKHFETNPYICKINQESKASSEDSKRCDVNFDQSMQKEHTEIKEVPHDVKPFSDCSKTDHAYSERIRSSIENLPKMYSDILCSESSKRLNPPREKKSVAHLNDPNAECITLGNDPVDHQYSDSEETGVSNKNILSISHNFKHPDISNISATQETEKHLNQDLIEKLMKDCEAKMAVCQHCKENCTSLKLLKKHYVTVHKLNPYLCNVCGKGFDKAKLLIKHMNAEGHRIEVLKCTVCHKIQGSLARLKEHYLTHAKIWPYKCTNCNKGFIRASDLRKHVRVHTGEKPYKCSECNSCFISSSSLSQHHKKHLETKPYICEMCGQGHVEFSALQIHYRLHNGEKPYSCPTCDLVFSRSHSLKLHMRSHTGERPNLCSVCGKSFLDQSNLKRHLRIHSGEKPFVCKTCNTAFNQSSALKKHAQRCCQKSNQ